MRLPVRTGAQGSVQESGRHLMGMAPTHRTRAAGLSSVTCEVAHSTWRSQCPQGSPDDSGPTQQMRPQPDTWQEPYPAPKLVWSLTCRARPPVLGQSLLCAPPSL